MKLGGRRLNFVRACLTAVLTVVAVGLSPARAVEAINVRTDAQAIDLTDSVERHVLPLIAAGKVRPVIDSTFPLAQASAAHARMEASAHIGKIVLVV